MVKLPVGKAMTPLTSIDAPPATRCTRCPSGFSLLELLVVITVIGIIASLVISSVSGAAQDSRMVIARQQQAVLQNALNAWITANSTGGKDLGDAMESYTGAANATAKLGLLANYLQAGSYDHFVTYSTASQIRSDAMQKAGVYLEFSAWTTDSYPSVQLRP